MQPAFDPVEPVEWKVYSRFKYLNLTSVTQNETCLIDFWFLSKFSPLDSYFTYYILLDFLIQLHLANNYYFHEKVEMFTYK